MLGMVLNRWARQLGRWALGRLQIFKIRIRRLRARLMRLLRKILQIRWHDVVWYLRDLLYAIRTYIRNTPPKQIVTDFRESVLVILETAWRSVNKNWTSRLASLLVGAMIILFCIFHFYLANILLLYGMYDDVYKSMSQARQSIWYFQSKDTWPRDPDESNQLLEQLDQSTKQIEGLKSELPRPAYVSYALRNISGADQNTELIIDNEPQRVLSTTAKSLRDFSITVNTYETIRDFNDPLENPTEYRDILTSAHTTLSQLSTDTLFSSRQLIVIVQVLKSETELFIANQQRTRFEQNQDQYFDELHAELSRQWSGLTREATALLSEYESDYERLLFFIANNFESIDR